MFVSVLVHLMILPWNLDTPGLSKEILILHDSVYETLLEFSESDQGCKSIEYPPVGSWRKYLLFKVLLRVGAVLDILHTFSTSSPFF